MSYIDRPVTSRFADDFQILPGVGSINIPQVGRYELRVTGSLSVDFRDLVRFSFSQIAAASAKAAATAVNSPSRLFTAGAPSTNP